VELNFKKWLESMFGQPVDEPLASEAPSALNNGALPSYDLTPLPGRKKKKTMYALLKRQNKH
jgi:hypothetical protein